MIGLLVSLVVAFGCSWADGAVLTFSVSGRIGDSVYDPLGVLSGLITAGDAWSGTFSYDTAWPDILPDNPAIGDYFAPAPSGIVGILLRVGSLAFQTNPNGSLDVNVMNRPLPMDEFSESGNGIASGITVDRLGLGLHLFDYSGTVFSNDSLPTSFSRDAWSDAVIQVGAQNPDFSFSASIAEIAPIPEPSTVIVWSLLWASGVGIGWSRRRRPAA
jgi:hypothetical protein